MVLVHRVSYWPGTMLSANPEGLGSSISQPLAGPPDITCQSTTTFSGVGSRRALPNRTKGLAMLLITCLVLFTSFNLTFWCLRPVSIRAIVRNRGNASKCNDRPTAAWSACSMPNDWHSASPNRSMFCNQGTWKSIQSVPARQTVADAYSSEPMQGVLNQPLPSSAALEVRVEIQRCLTDNAVSSVPSLPTYQSDPGRWDSARCIGSLREGSGRSRLGQGCETIHPIASDYRTKHHCLPKSYRDINTNSPISDTATLARCGQRRLWLWHPPFRSNISRAETLFYSSLNCID